MSEGQRLGSESRVVLSSTITTTNITTTTTTTTITTTTTNKSAKSHFACIRHLHYHHQFV